MRIQDMRAGRLSLRGLDNGRLKNSQGCVVVKFNFRSWQHQVNKANPSSTKILHVVGRRGATALTAAPDYKDICIACGRSCSVL